MKYGAVRGSGERGDCLGGKRGERQMDDVSTRGQLAEHEAQGMPAVERVVPVCRSQQHRHRLESARQHPNDVQGGLVRPVQILQHDDRRTALPESPCHRLHELVRGFAVRIQLRRDLEHRTERPGRKQCVAPPAHGRHVSVAVTKGVEERRLPDPRLAGDEYE